MKRIVKLLIAISLLFSMAGCSNNSGTEENNEISICGEKKEVLDNVTYYINEDFGQFELDNNVQDYQCPEDSFPRVWISNDEIDDATKYMTENQKAFVNKLYATLLISEFDYDTLTINDLPAIHVNGTIEKDVANKAFGSESKHDVTVEIYFVLVASNRVLEVCLFNNEDSLAVNDLEEFVESIEVSEE